MAGTNPFTPVIVAIVNMPQKASIQFFELSTVLQKSDCDVLFALLLDHTLAIAREYTKT
jgi:hypothetical protein